MWGVPEDPWALSPVPPAPADGSSSLDWTRCPQEKSLKRLVILLAHCHFRRTHLKEAPPFSLLSPLPLVPSSPPPPPSIFNHPTETRGCFTCNEVQRQRACPLRPSLFLSDQATHTGNPGRAEDSPAPLSDYIQEAQRSSLNTTADSVLENLLMVQRDESLKSRSPSTEGSGCR